MRGDEKRVVDAFERHLRNEGWTVEREVAFVDLRAQRGEEVMFVEAKGRVGGNAGLDADTMFGQLLRRMTETSARYAVVVPTEAVASAVRVPKHVRDLLHIEIYEVDDANVVRRVEP